MRVVLPELSNPMTRIFASRLLNPRASEIKSNKPIPRWRDGKITDKSGGKSCVPFFGEVS
jgi:hypothetical protein